MKELKDIVLNRGDKIHFDYGVYFIDSNEDGKKFCNIFAEGEDSKVSKIERLIKYETIYEAPKEILDKEEKEYLEAVIRPFRYRAKCIKKIIAMDITPYAGEEFIIIFLEREAISLPFFKKNTMYKGMELNKEYTLEELGLFKGE